MWDEMNIFLWSHSNDKEKENFITQLVNWLI